MKWFERVQKAVTQPAHGPSPLMEEIAGNFTPRAQQVLALSRMEANRFNHNFVGTGHLLLGLIKLGQGVAVQVLTKSGLGLENVRGEVEKQIRIGPDQRISGYIPYTPRVKKVLALAAEEASQLNHTYVGTEHLLLGILREGDGVAGRVLKSLNVNAETMRTEILKELDPNFRLDSRQNQSTSPTPVSASGPHKARHAIETDAKRGLVDVGKRFDVYCMEHDRQTVVYCNVLFKGVKKLFDERSRDALSDFLEIEQADGTTVFVVRYSVIKFCEPGVTPNSENAPGERP